MVFKKRLEVALSAMALVDKMLSGHRLDLMISVVFSNLVDCVIL